MTSEARYERDLTAILEDLYLGPTPDYRHEALAVATHRRQRPAWTFPGRWFPMADIASQPALAPRVPWRTVGLAVLVIALALGAVALVAGSRQTKVPSPFGLARNGLIVYALDGDIFTLDPAAGRTAPLVTGPDRDFDPVYSPDGTRVAFRRETTRDGSPSEVLVVVASDGSNPVAVSTEMDSEPGYAEWAPDSQSLIVEDPNGAAVWILDASAPAEPRVVAADATTTLRPFRPPEGDEVLIVRNVDRATLLILLDLASGEERVLVTGEPGQELGGARWSPDGRQLIYVAKPADEVDSRRLFIVDVDGGAEPRQLTDGTTNEYDMDAVWSHDGSRIAFTRWEQVDAVSWDVRPIMLYTVAGATLTEIGPRARDVRAAAPNEADGLATAGEGLYIDFSPDASKLIAMPSEATGHPALVDLASGDWEVVDALVTPAVAANVWQRTALP